MFNTIFGILIIIFALFLVVAVLMQSSKNRSLSGVISGGAETFFGKSKAGNIEKVLNTLTIIASVIFVVLCLVVYIGNAAEPAVDTNTKDNADAGEIDGADDEADAEGDTDAGETDGETVDEGETDNGADEGTATDENTEGGDETVVDDEK